ncbi:hypothetical protein [Actinomadura atramentaria]|uniref:hypothetical protein n=1 Tax=Actinomadura atramentaria TaxID=1990 RepID=UPI001F0B2D98|nr:hypothetical protein [Actinomadura atramentaria]
MSRPSNQRVTFLDVLALTLRERYPGVRTEVAQFSAGLPPLLRVFHGRVGQDIGCDMGRDGWTYVLGFDPRRNIAPTSDPVRAARAVAEMLGIRSHPER